MPLAFHLTGGEANDSPQLPLLLGIGPDVTPRAILTDKGLRRKEQPGSRPGQGHRPCHTGAQDHGPQPETLPEDALQRPGADRAGDREAEALQADRPALRDNSSELPVFGLVRLRFDLGQIRPQDLEHNQNGRIDNACLNRCRSARPSRPTWWHEFLYESHVTGLIEAMTDGVSGGAVGRGCGPGLPDRRGGSLVVLAEAGNDLLAVSFSRAATGARATVVPGTPVSAAGHP